MRKQGEDRETALVGVMQRDLSYVVTPSCRVTGRSFSSRDVRLRYLMGESAGNAYSAWESAHGQLMGAVHYFAEGR
jgi:hypothetical protein